MFFQQSEVVIDLPFFDFADADELVDDLFLQGLFGCAGRLHTQHKTHHNDRECCQCDGHDQNLDFDTIQKRHTRSSRI